MQGQTGHLEWQEFLRRAVCLFSCCLFSFSRLNLEEGKHIEFYVCVNVTRHGKEIQLIVGLMIKLSDKTHE